MADIIDFLRNLGLTPTQRAQRMPPMPGPAPQTSVPGMPALPQAPPPVGSLGDVPTPSAPPPISSDEIARHAQETGVYDPQVRIPGPGDLGLPTPQDAGRFFKDRLEAVGRQIAGKPAGPQRGVQVPELGSPEAAQQQTTPGPTLEQPQMAGQVPAPSGAPDVNPAPIGIAPRSPAPGMGVLDMLQSLGLTPPQSVQDAWKRSGEQAQQPGAAFTKPAEGPAPGMDPLSLLRSLGLIPPQAQELQQPQMAGDVPVPAGPPAIAPNQVQQPPAAQPPASTPAPTGAPGTAFGSQAGELLANLGFPPTGRGAAPPTEPPSGTVTAPQPTSAKPSARSVPSAQPAPGSPTASPQPAPTSAPAAPTPAQQPASVPDRTPDRWGISPRTYQLLGVIGTTLAMGPRPGENWAGHIGRAIGAAQMYDNFARLSDVELANKEREMQIAEKKLGVVTRRTDIDEKQVNAQIAIARERLRLAKNEDERQAWEAELTRLEKLLLLPGKVAVMQGQIQRPEQQRDKIINELFEKNKNLDGTPNFKAIGAQWSALSGTKPMSKEDAASAKRALDSAKTPEERARIEGMIVQRAIQNGWKIPPM